MAKLKKLKAKSKNLKAKTRKPRLRFVKNSFLQINKAYDFRINTSEVFHTISGILLDANEKEFLIKNTIDDCLVVLKREYLYVSHESSEISEALDN